MKDETKTKEELIKELQQFRRQVTRLVKAEHEWNKEEELDLRARMLDQSRDGFMLHDTEGNFLYANEVVLKERGYTREEFLKMNVRDLVTAKQYSKVKRWWKDSGDEKNRTEEVEIRRKDGTWFLVEVSTSKDNYGGKTYILCTTRDITERKQAEQNLQKAEQNFRTSLENSPLGIRIVSTEGEVLYANQAILDIHGYSNIEELKATLTEKSYTPESYTKHQERKEKRRRGTPIPDDYEISIIRKDGEIRHLAVSRKPVEWDGEIQYQVIYQDVTGRKKAEKALRSSEERMRLFMDSATDAFSIYDSEFNLIDCNETRMKMYFPGLKKVDVIGKNVLELVPHLNGTDRYARMQEVVKTGKPFYDDDTISYIDDPSAPETEFRQISFKAFKVGDGLGVVSTDITERKKVEEALRANEQELEMLMENLPGMVFYKDSNLRYRRVNKAFTRLHNIQREEIIGRTIGEASLMNNELAESDDRELLERGQVSTRIVEFTDATDSSRWQKITKVPIKDENGKIRGVLGVGMDISDILEAQEELKLRMEMLDQSRNGIIVSDTNGNFIYGNRVVLEERGYTQEEFLKLNVRDLVVLPDDRSFDEWWQQVIEKGHYRGEYGVRRKDGSLIPVEAILTKAKSGEKDYVISVVQDITERKKAEEELRLRSEMLSQSTDGILLHDLDP